MSYIVMRKDYSATLADKDGPMVFENREAAEKTAKNFSGVVVNLESKLISCGDKIIRIETLKENMGIKDDG